MQVTIVTIEPNPLTHGYEYAILNKIQNDRCIWRRIRNLRLAYGDCIGFTNAEYHIVCVDFIYSSRGRLKRDRGFANPLSLSNTSPDPWGYPLRRGILAAAVYANIGFLYPVQVVTRQFRIIFGCLCSGWYRSRFSRVAQLVSFVFHYWGEGRLFLRLRWVLQWSFVGFALTAGGSFVWVGNGMR